MEIYFQPLKVCVARINAGLFYFMPVKKIFIAEEKAVNIEITYTAYYLYFDVYYKDKRKIAFIFDIETAEEFKNTIGQYIYQSKHLPVNEREEVENG